MVMADRARTTAKDFFLWAGAMIGLYWSVVAFILLFFNYVDYAFPNALSYLPDPYSSGIPYEMSSIVVLFPVFLVIMWFIRRDIAKDASRKDIWVRRWALIFTLFVAGLTVVIDVITLLTSFLRGEELTEAFLLKVVLVFFVAAVVFMHFIADLWGYWEKYPKRNHYVLYGVVLLGIFAVVSGFFIVGTPQQARLYRLDDQKINDLQQIQSQVVSYWQAKQALPAKLSDLNDAISGFSAPLDPQSGASYDYATTGTMTFQLCATFNAETQPYSSYASYARTVPVSAPGYGAPPNDVWQHSAGHFCFDRTIDPQLYPPLKKTP